MSYIAKAAFDRIHERLGHRNQTISTLKTQIADLEKEVKEKDLTISSQDSDLHNLRERNNQLAENINVLQIREEAVEERHRAKLEKVAEKAKMVGAI